MNIPIIPPVWKFIGAGVAVALGGLLIVGGLHSCDKRHDHEINNAVQSGAVVERATQQAETINAVQNAQEVMQHPTANQLNVVCSHYDRNCPHGS